MINEVLDVMVERAREGMTMPVITDETGIARKLADRAVVLDTGSSVEDWPSEQVSAAPDNPRARDFPGKFRGH